MLSSSLFFTIVIALSSAAETGEPRTFLAAAAWGDHAFFAGGASSADCTSLFINHTAVFPGGSPITPPDLTEARCGLAGASADRMVLFAGGNAATGYSDIVDAYSYSDSTARYEHSVLHLAQARSWLVGASGAHQAAFTGGALQPFALSPAVDLLREGQLRKGPALPSGRIYHAAGITAGQNGTVRVWVAGGTDEGGVTGTVHMLNLPEKEAMEAAELLAEGWMAVTAGLSSPRTRLAAATAQTPLGEVVCFGGGEGEQTESSEWQCSQGWCASDAVDCFSHDGKHIHALRLAEPRSRLAAVGKGCKMVFAGGRAPNSTTGSDTVDVFDLCSSPPRHVVAPPLSQARMDLAGTVVGDSKSDGYIIFIGGSAHGTVSDFADVLDLSSL